MREVSNTDCTILYHKRQNINVFATIRNRKIINIPNFLSAFKKHTTVSVCIVPFHQVIELNFLLGFELVLIHKKSITREIMMGQVYARNSGPLLLGPLIFLGSLMNTFFTKMD